ncbi:hypothetical protein K474DRAFT_1029780 [Panus rudis PR-1116 ss-1]|nr:hypothetical protein K474DRAFT_1029780 [Panus rudis PR-1116 ss-1]
MSTANDVGVPNWNLVASVLNWGLLGVLVVQVYIYHIAFPKDRAYFKCLVFCIFLVDCLQTFLLTADLFGNFVYGWGKPDSFTTIGTGWLSFIVIGGLDAAVVQLSFAWRLWILTRSVLLTAVIVVLAASQAAGAIVGGIQLKILTFMVRKTPSNVAITLWLAGSALVDVVIAISMTISLLRMKRSHQLRAGTKLNDQAQLNHSLDTLLHECPAIILAKLYSNTLLAGFNNRKRISARYHHAESKPAIVYYASDGFEVDSTSSSSEYEAPNDTLIPSTQACV